MKHAKFFAGVALGIAIGAVAPVLGQSSAVSMMTIGSYSYGIARGAAIFTFCADGGQMIPGSTVDATPMSSVMAGGSASGYRLHCP